MSYSYVFKFILVGDSSVGKTSLLKRFIDGSYLHNYDSTLGVDFAVKIIPVKNQNIKLQIWDTAGQEKFKTITTSYYRGISGIILVYDITNRQSFLNLKNWIADIKLVNPLDIPIMIVGNKADLQTNRQIPLDELNTFAFQNEYLLKEISVKNNICITSVFHDLAEFILNKIETRSIQASIENGIKSNSILLDTHPPKSKCKYNCCSIQ